MAKVSDGAKGHQPPPFMRTPINPGMVPRRHAPGALKPGDSVWYCDLRYWVLRAPPDWSETCGIQICTRPVRPGFPPPNDAHVQFVHADCLELAPTKAGAPAHVNQPTRHAIEVQQLKKTNGITHVGDDVGKLLEGKNLDQVYKIAARFLKVPESELRAKYGHLNPGQQRMNCGNRMRGHARKGVSCAA